MPGVLDWSPPWSKSVGGLAPIAPTKGLPSVASCIVRPPGFPGLELAVPHDAAAGIETLVEHALDCRRYRAQLARPADAGQPQRRYRLRAKLFTADKDRA